LGTAITDQNLILEKIRMILNYGNAFCHSAHNFLSSRLLSRNIKIRKHKTKIMLVALYGRESCSMTSKEAHRLRVFKNSMLRIIFGPKRDNMIGDWRKLHNEELHYL
jgi:hypothetical protein